MNEELLKIKNKAKKLLKELEGLYLTPYKCIAGKWTIGYGDNLEANGLTADEASRVNFDTNIIPQDAVNRWHKAGIGTKEIKDILPKYSNAIKISKETANYLLDNEVNSIISKLAGNNYFDNAPDNVKIALICICFQCGFRGMHENIYLTIRDGFSQKKYFIDCIQRRDYEGASEVVRGAIVFKRTKTRALKMADLIEKAIV